MTETKNILIAQRYSDALVDIAKEGNLSYEKLSTDLNVVNDTLLSSPDLMDFLTNPLVSVDDKKETVIQIFSSEIDGLILNFLKVLIDKNRFDTFSEILNSYNKTLDSINNISRVKVTSAITISDEVKARLIEKLSQKLGKQVVVDNEVDENVIAGLIIQIGDNIIDTSLRHKLDELERNITT